MPISLTIDGGVIFTVAEGDLSFEDILNHIEAKWSAGIMALPEIVDARNTTIAFSHNELRSIASKVVKALDGKVPGKTAVVTDSALARGRAHSYSIFTGCADSEFDVFADVNAARAWLLNEAQ